MLSKQEPIESPNFAIDLGPLHSVITREGQQIAFDDTDFISLLHQLKDASLRNDREETMRLLKEIVPDFHHEEGQGSGQTEEKSKQETAVK